MLKCFICKNQLSSTIFRSCDRDCCSRECQITLVKLNLRIDPQLKYPERWIKTYNDEISDDEVQESDKDDIEVCIIDTNKKKRQKKIEKESSIIMYKPTMCCCSH